MLRIEKSPVRFLTFVGILLLLMFFIPSAKATTTMLLQPGEVSGSGLLRAVIDDILDHQEAGSMETRRFKIFGSGPVPGMVREPFCSYDGLRRTLKEEEYRYDEPQLFFPTIIGVRRGKAKQFRLFQGLWTDPTTGLSYARNRWYDARTASWLSEDPAGAVDSPNLYAFVGWGPHVGRDPMGLAMVPEPELPPCTGAPLAHCAPDTGTFPADLTGVPEVAPIPRRQETIGPPRRRVETMGPAEPDTEFGEVGDALYAGGAFVSDPSNYANTALLLFNAQEDVIFGHNPNDDVYIPSVFELKSRRQKQWTAVIAVAAVVRGGVKNASKPKGLVRNDRALARNLNTPEGHTPHHLITVAEAGKYPVMHRAAELGYEINRAENGFSLPNTIDLAKELDLPYHPKRGRHTIRSYTGPLAARLEKLQQRYESGLVTDAALLEEVGAIENSMRVDLLSGELRLNSRYSWYKEGS